MHRKALAVLLVVGLAAIGAAGCGADSPFNPKNGAGSGLAPVQTAGQTTGSGGVTGAGSVGGISGGLTTGGVVSGGGTTSGTTSSPPNTTQLQIQSLTISAPGEVGGESATGTVTLNASAPAGGATITLSSTNPALSVPATITVEAGATQATFTITTKPVTQVTTGAILADYGTGITQQQSVTFTVTPSPAVVTPSDHAVSTLSATECTPGQPITVSITITPPAGSVAYAGSDMVPPGSTVTNLGGASGSNAGTDPGIPSGISFDAAHHAVNFFFLDATPRTITYTFTPPVAAGPTIVLSGDVAFNGVDQPIVGERIILCSSREHAGIDARTVRR